MAVPAAAFGVVFVGSSYPVSHEQFARVDATHWVSFQQDGMLGVHIDQSSAAGAGCRGHSKSKLHRAEGGGPISAATRQQCPGGCGAGAIYLSWGGRVVRRSHVWLRGIASSLRHEEEAGTTAGSTEGRSAPSTHQRSCRCSGLSPNRPRSSDPGWCSWASQWSRRVRCRPLWDQLESLRLAVTTCEGSSGPPVLACHL